MTTHRPDASVVEPPIVAVGPCGSTFLSVDPSIDEALDHLAHHQADLGVELPSPASTDAPRAPVDVALYDRRGRRLRIDATGARPTLVVDDPVERRGEVVARVEETFAHMRDVAYRDPTPPDDVDPAQLRPPAPPDLPHPSAPDQSDVAGYDAFIESLCQLMSYQAGPADHPGNWWHNIFHR